MRPPGSSWRPTGTRERRRLILVMRPPTPPWRRPTLCSPTISSVRPSRPGLSLALRPHGRSSSRGFRACARKTSRGGSWRRCMSGATGRRPPAAEAVTPAPDRSRDQAMAPPPIPSTAAEKQRETAAAKLDLGPAPRAEEPPQRSGPPSGRPASGRRDSVVDDEPTAAGAEPALQQDRHRAAEGVAAAPDAPAAERPEQRREPVGVGVERGEPRRRRISDPRKLRRGRAGSSLSALSETREAGTPRSGAPAS